MEIFGADILEIWLGSNMLSFVINLKKRLKFEKHPADLDFRLK